MLDYFIFFGKEHHTKLFDLQWKQHKSNLSGDGDITFSCIYEKVWKPTISSCLSLLNGIFTKSLLLTDISKKLNIQTLGSQLEILCTAMHKCYPKELSFSEPYSWIAERVNHIEVYMNFVKKSENVSALKYCLKLRELLQLKGDFLDITKLWKCVSKFNCTYSLLSMVVCNDSNWHEIVCFPKFFERQL